VNVLKDHLRITVETLVSCGVSQREICRRTGIDRKTIRRYAAGSKSPGVATGSEAEAPFEDPPPRPPAPDTTGASACEPHRSWIESQVQLGRNAVSIYQDLVEQHAFTHRYNSVKRFVRETQGPRAGALRRAGDLPGEEARWTSGRARRRCGNGKYRRPHLFVMTLKYSGKSFRKVDMENDQEIWARLHEEAFRVFGGSCLSTWCSTTSSRA
jgi:transposase